MSIKEQIEKLELKIKNCNDYFFIYGYSKQLEELRVKAKLLNNGKVL
jgi:hypothetical protein